jgi:hypothetical protein
LSTAGEPDAVDNLAQTQDQPICAASVVIGVMPSTVHIGGYLSAVVDRPYVPNVMST